MLTARAMLALLLLGTAAPALALAPFTLHYDVRFGPLRLLSMRTTIELLPDVYRTRTRMRTEGLIGLLFPWTSDSITEGLRGPLRPRRHTSEGRYRRQRRVVELRYADDGSVETRIEPPPDAEGRDTVAPELRRSTVDPLTASLAAMEQECRGQVPVFDGRRRYDLRLEDLGRADVPAAHAGPYAGSARRCRAVVAPLGGFWRADAPHDESPSTLDFWIAEPRADLVPVPVYLELTGKRGTLRIVLDAIVSPPADAD